MKKLIPAFMLFAFPFLVKTAVAQNSEKINLQNELINPPHYYEYYEFLYENEIYRGIDISSTEDSLRKNIIFEKHGETVDTVFNRLETENKMKEIERIQDYNEKVDMAEKIVDNAIKYLSLDAKIYECYKIRSLFETESDYWNILQKHKEAGKQIGNSIAYLASSQGIEDIKDPVKKPDFWKELQKSLEQISDVGPALENFDKSLKNFNKHDPVSQYENERIMQESKIMAEKYLGSDIEFNYGEDQGLKQKISYEILNALEKTCEGEDYDERRTIFMECMANFPRIATNPLAIFIAERFIFYREINDILEVYKATRIKSEKELKEKSTNIDFDYEFYTSLLDCWETSYSFYNSLIPFLNETKESKAWETKSNFLKEFMKLEKSYDPISEHPEIIDSQRLSNLGYDIQKQYEETEEIQDFFDDFDKYENIAKNTIKNINQKTKKYNQSLIKEYINWKEKIKNSGIEKEIKQKTKQDNENLINRFKN